MEQNTLRQHRTIWQEHSAKDFASYESYKRAGILYVFPPFITARMGQKIGRRPQTQLCGDALNSNNIDAENKIASFRVKQSMPYEFKVNYARIRAWEFYNECGKRDLDCYVSVGGLDSITLFFFLKSIGINVPAVSVSSLEDVSIQKIHKQIGVISLPPAVREMMVRDGISKN